VPPNEIVILAPYLSDALCFSLEDRFKKENIPTHILRPSSSLYQDHIIQCLITLVALSFPYLEIIPSRDEVAQALNHTIEGLDMIRSVLLTQQVYYHQNGNLTLLPINKLRPNIYNRIPETSLKRYEKLRHWLEDSQQKGFEALDISLIRIFEEILSFPGFKFHSNFHAAEITSNLIKSYQNFRSATWEFFSHDQIQLSKEYCKIIKEGILAAYYPTYLFSEDNQSMNAVIISPAFNFIIHHKPVDYQFWLDIGSLGWSERPYQPLTHTYVLHRNWETGRLWTNKDEVENMKIQLEKTCKGLINRCKKKIYLSFCDIDNTGRENKSPLLKAFDRLLQDSFLFGT
jgi:hypothetical protein